ncbi:hypothetical protein ACFPT7_15700 [Acidicapsa dinghuensis]|uniref:CPBP family intramembrane metalloprotease n=1 Tax=Acidicapsa dinghuensis TaxID=2218256 RepID=A0ABW1EHG4_9BACT|nr:hypothetical protein [Acidicapsa dinghuensis]
MSTTSAPSLPSQSVPPEPGESAASLASSTLQAKSRPRVFIAWTSFVFALLQSLCTFFAAANGLRFAIGLGALALTSWQAAFIREFHSSWFRRPMNGIALAGALLNLVVLWQIRRLRARPAAQWRTTAPSARKLRGERMQFWLSVVTLVLVGIEEYLHFTQHGRL